MEVLLSMKQQKMLLLFSAGVTLLEALLGFFLALIFGCLAALTFFHYRALGTLFWPILLISQALPTLAIAPLLILWLGYGMVSKIVLVVIFLFFPITSAFLDGLKRTNPLWLQLAHLMTQNKLAILWHVRIPAALPALASGIRIASAGAVMAAVIGEWVGASQGLGFLLLEANARFQTALVFAAIVVLVALSLAFFKLTNWILRFV
jgi:putative hydroxymethylpyrimidine transport system permease protein